MCVCSGTGHLGKKLKTQPPSPQSEKRCLFHSWNGGQGKHKTKEKRKEGKRECYRCYFSLDRKGKISHNYQTSLVKCSELPVPLNAEIKEWVHFSCSVMSYGANGRMRPKM